MGASRVAVLCVECQPTAPMMDQLRAPLRPIPAAVCTGRSPVARIALGGGGGDGSAGARRVAGQAADGRTHLCRFAALAKPADWLLSAGLSEVDRVDW